MKNKDYFSREISWIHFNKRVLAEAQRFDNPIMERMKFISIVSSNFDEFFMVRVASLLRSIKSSNSESDPSGMEYNEILNEILTETHDICETQQNLLRDSIFPYLESEGLKFKKSWDFTNEEREYSKQIFMTEIFPILTPLRISETSTLLDTITGLTINLLIHYQDINENYKRIVIPLPENIPRFYNLGGENSETITTIEEILIDNINSFVPDGKMESHILFRLTRDADMGVDEREDDFMGAMEEILIARRMGFPVRLEINNSEDEITDQLNDELKIPENSIFKTDTVLNLSDLMQILSLKDFSNDLFPKMEPQPSRYLSRERTIWELLREKDLLLHHPYESFDLVTNMLQEAAEDESVLAIKMTLYRTSGNSPLITALEHAAQNGKQVIVVIELKARFDENRNITWAKRLSDAGATVVYGVENLKVHAKALLIIRKETDGIVKYLHMGTGNYNDKTAKLYCDISLLTTKEEICKESSLFFNAITGYSDTVSLDRLAMAPIGLRSRLKQLIVREIERTEQGEKGHIIAKMNSLVDTEMIDLLYKASKAGVKIELNIRGICSLIPGVKGKSENIKVISIIGRFLEHTRAYYFRNGGNREIFLSSADMIPRNLDRRVELFFPIVDKEIKKRVLAILVNYFLDNTQSHELKSDGSWAAIRAKKNQKPISAQNIFLQDAIRYSEENREKDKFKLNVRRETI